MLSSRISKSLSFLVLCIALLSGITLFSVLQPEIADAESSTSRSASNANIFVDNGTATSDVLYLSDIPYENAQVGWGNLTFDKNGVNNGGITLTLNGSATTFKKGIFAHATSTVDYDISEYSNKYDYFVTYYGLNSTNNNVGNGVKFYVYTSNDGENWDLKTDDNPTAIKSGDGARQFKINIQGVKYLRLYADANGSNASDHAAWADTKLVHEGYTDNIVRTVEDLDAEIMSRYTSGPVPEDLQLTLLQRNLIAAVGQYGLRTFVEANPANRTMLEWFLNDEKALRLWTMGGTPNGSYVNALQVLSNLYAAHKEDLEDATFVNAVRNGDLNLRMMLALSLAHARPINLWIYNNQTSNPVTRYEIFKSMYANNKLGNPTMFANFTVEEMRWVMTAQMDDESILWLRDYTSKFGNGFQLSDRFNPYNYITYRTGYSYGNPKYYSQANYATWDAKYNLSAYNITYKSGYPKLWIVFEEGSVCGGLSKTGSNIQCSWGYPATPVGQPGHCAYIYMYDAGGGKNAWQLTNSIVANGWANTTPTMMPYGWGSGGANVTNNGTIQSASYMFLSQEAQNEYDKFEKANMLMLMAKVYRSDWDKLVQIYNDAYDQEHINLDAWNGLINIALNERTNSSQEDLYKLAEKCANDMKYHPLPMYDLTRRIGAKITDPVIKSNFMMLVQSTLQQASRVSDSQWQGKEIRAVANALLGYVDNRLATFSFDGANANQIMLGASFRGAGTPWEYSLDGGNTWTAVHEDVATLSPAQVNSITAANDIKVRIIDAGRAGSIFTIDITQPSFPTAGISTNDDENRIYGTTSLMEYYISEDMSATVAPADATWTSFSTVPNLEGNKRLFIRNRPTGTQLATPSNVYYTFSENIIVENHNYIKPNHLTIAGAHGGAALGAPANILDGNANTYWLTGKGALPHYVTIGLDEPRFISGFDFVPKPVNSTLGVPYGFVKKYTISVSMDGKNWTDVVANKATSGRGTQSTTFAPTQAKYVKFTCLAAESDNSGGFLLGQKGWMSLADVKIYEDLTADPTPRATVRYDTTSKTNHDVVAELVDTTRPVTVTNTEGGSKSYTFTENGEFTFEFEDAAGNKGAATASVDWIDKTAPEMDVSYSSTEPTNADVVATMTFDEPVVIKTDEISILNEDSTTYNGSLSSGSKTITFVENDSFDIEFTDEAGNVGRKTIAVDWIDREKPTGTVTYSTNDITDQSVVATVAPDKEGVTVTSEGGDTHTFDSNGEFTFELLDAAGNAGTATASVYWIKQTPQINVSYSPATFEPTKEPVVVTIDIPDGYRIMNNGGKKTYTFTRSGEFAFQYFDPDGMQGSYPVTVDWIDYEAPEATITYDNPTATTKDVTATLALNDKSQPVKITSAGGSTHTFTENGEFTFKYEDALGNKGESVVKVDWIDRDAPTATVGYSNKNVTADDVIATLKPSEAITITNAEGVDTAEDGTFSHTFTENGEFTFEFRDAAGNTGSATAKVTWINRDIPTAKIEYSTQSPTVDDVVATLIPDKENITITNNDGKTTYTFTDNGEFTFELRDELGNKGSATAKVDWIDREAPVATITYDKPTATNKDVIATLTLEDMSEPVSITNNGGQNTYTFTDNGEFTFEFKDALGNNGEAKAKVDWIDRVAPTATVRYNTTVTTAENVTATLEPSESVISINSSGVDTAQDGTLSHTFIENGMFVFEFKDAAGNTGSATAKVTWINHNAPTAKIEYSTKEPTNGDVVAKLIPDKENVTVINNGGKTTYTFTDNGEFTFEFKNSVGKTGTATAKVDWIDREAPTGIVNYDTTDPTNGNVTATLVPSKEVTVMNGEGTLSYTFTDNGEFTFELQDALGNAGTATAKVDWIDRVAPTATVHYSTTSPTSANVTAVLKPNEAVTVTNGNGALSHTFTDNGEFTFEYQDAAGNSGSTTAKVDWINRSAPPIIIDHDHPSTPTTPNPSTTTPDEPFVDRGNDKSDNSSSGGDDSSASKSDDSTQGEDGADASGAGEADAEASEVGDNADKLPQGKIAGQGSTSTPKKESPSTGETQGDADNSGGFNILAIVIGLMVASAVALGAALAIRLIIRKRG